MSEKIVNVNIAPGVSLQTTTVYTTPSIDVRSARNIIGLRIQAASASGGAPDFKIDLAISDYADPPTEPTQWSILAGPATNYDLFSIPVLASWHTTFGTTDWRMLAFGSITPTVVGTTLLNPLAQWYRFRFTGIGSNPGDTILNAKFTIQEGM